VLYDGDPAGIKASLRGIDMILEAGMNVRTVIFPEGEDPDSYSRKLGTTAFQAYVNENEQDFISFKASLYAEEAAGDPIKKAESIKEILSTIAKVPDGVKRAVYMKATARLLGFEENVLWTELNKLTIRDRRQRPAPPPPETEPHDLAVESEKSLPTHNDRIAIHEREFVRLLLKFGTAQSGDEKPFHELYVPEIDDVAWVNPVYKEILTMYLNSIQEDRQPNVEYYLQNGSEAVRTTVVDLVSERHEVSNLWFDRYKIFVPNENDVTDKLFMTNLARLKRSVVQKLIDEHMEKLKSTQDPEEIDQLLHVQQELKETEKELARMLGIVIPK
jgi:DNA primase